MAQHWRNVFTASSKTHGLSTGGKVSDESLCIGLTARRVKLVRITRDTFKIKR